MPRQPRPAPPAPLHLIRLAQGSPGIWVTLPGEVLRVIGLVSSLKAQPGRGWLLCLKGEVVLDLPNSEFVRLRAGEGYQVGAVWDALPTRSDSVLLLVSAWPD